MREKFEGFTKILRGR